MRRIRLFVSILLVLFGIVALEIFGALTPGYDPRSNFLSELGATGAPYAALVSYGVFVPIGLLWAVAAILIWRSLPAGLLGAVGAALLLANAVSYVGVGVFPCDAGCPAEGSFNQLMHNISGAIGYFLTPLALALIGFHLLGKGRAGFGAVTLAVAAASGLSFATMITDLDGEAAGTWQRLTDYSMTLWMALAALWPRKT